MKTYRVYAERVVIEIIDVKAKSEVDAMATAMEADNEEWSTYEDASWEIVNAGLIDEGESK